MMEAIFIGFAFLLFVAPFVLVVGVLFVIRTLLIAKKERGAGIGSKRVSSDDNPTKFWIILIARLTVIILVILGSYGVIYVAYRLLTHPS